MIRLNAREWDWGAKTDRGEQMFQTRVLLQWFGSIALIAGLTLSCAAQGGGNPNPKKIQPESQPGQSESQHHGQSESQHESQSGQSESQSESQSQSNPRKGRFNPNPNPNPNPAVHNRVNPVIVIPSSGANGVESLHGQPSRQYGFRHELHRTDDEQHLELFQDEQHDRRFDVRREPGPVPQHEFDHDELDDAESDVGNGPVHGRHDDG